MSRQHSHRNLAKPIGFGERTDARTGGGPISPSEPTVDPAEIVLRLATSTPEVALEAAVRLQAEARRQRDGALLSRASRAAGVAALQLRRLDVSAAFLRTAISAAERAGSARLVAEARMSLAATRIVAGSTQRALTEIDAALTGLDGPAAARAHVQRGTIFQAIGRTDDALAEFRTALPVLRREGDVEWEVRALSNRSVLHTGRRAFAAAESDLTAAAALCDRGGLALAGAYAKQNLACVKAAQGQVTAALGLFDAAAEAYRSLGVQVGSLLVDRGELLLSVRLTSEARAAADAAVSVLHEQRRRLDLPPAELLLSTASLLAGDAAGALTAARHARVAFVRLARRDGAALARFAALQAELVLQPAAVTPARFRRSAVELEAAGWLVPALEARVLAGRIALERGRPVEARADLRAASRARRTGPADARARAWLAEALLRRADGNRRGAQSAVTAGLRIVEEYQASLGATELRAHVTVHRGALARLGVRMALEDGSARKVFQWSERGRVSALLTRPPRPPADPGLAAALADLRTTMKEIEERLAAGSSAADLKQRQIRLERDIARRSRTLPGEHGGRTWRPVELDRVAAALGSAALLEYLHVDRVLHVVVVADGRCVLTPIGPVGAVAELVQQLSFALRRLARSAGNRSIATAGEMVRTLGAELEATLLAPVSRLVGDRPLVVVPSGVVQSLPWSILPSCLGRPISVAPSASHWAIAAGRQPPAAGAAVVVVAGPGLPGAREEARIVAALHPGATLLVDEAATVESLSVADGARIVHVAAHGMLRADNPFFSALLMADGPLTVYDLERLPHAPDHVILAACETARVHRLAGEEVLGFTSALLVQGARSLIAPVIPVPDAATVSLMTRYHGQLLRGDSPAAALAAAQQHSAGDGPASLAAAAAFVCTGAGLAR